MDILTKEECQAIIDNIDEWEEVAVTKIKGGRLEFKQAPVDYWKEQYPLMLHELVLKYDVGDYCSEHRDSSWTKISPDYVAYEVWITPLNDDYEGGDLYFAGELIEQVVGVPIKYRKYILHEITPVTSGTRYSLVSWLFIKI